MQETKFKIGEIVTIKKNISGLDEFSMMHLFKGATGKVIEIGIYYDDNSDLYCISFESLPHIPGSWWFKENMICKQI